VLIHTSAGPFYQYTALSSRAWMSAVFLDALVRVAVPLFVMLSGALLLNAKAGRLTPSQLVRRVLKVALPLVVWSLFYVWWLKSVGDTTTAWLSFLRQPVMYHLWFVYVLVGLYLLLPVLHAMYERLVENNFYLFLFLAVWFVGNCLPLLMPFPLINVMQINGFLGYAGYFILGAVIANAHRVRLSALWLLLAYLFCSVTTFALTVMFTHRAGAPSEIAYNYFSPNVAFAAVSIFWFFRSLAAPTWMKPIARWVSERAFIIYFIHILVLEYVRANPQVSRLAASLPMGLNILLVASLSFLISLAIASMIRIIPRVSNVTG